MHFTRFFVTLALPNLLTFEKTQKVLVFFAHLIVTLNKLLHLGIKNKRVFFVLLSIFRNFE